MKNPKPSTLDSQEHSPTQEKSFLRRWSKRKLDEPTAAQGGADDEPELLSPADQQHELNRADPSLDQSQHELTDEDMPAIETLDENSDFSGFLSPKVSETLKRQALRKLFHLPQFNITDGLDDYDEDFTSFDKLGDVVTHEMRRQIQQEAEKSQPGNIAKSHKQNDPNEQVYETANSDNTPNVNESENGNEPEADVTEHSQINTPMDT